MTDIEAEMAADVREHVELLRGVVGRQFGNSQRGLEYEAKLADIERRAADPRLYLAVVGEFSSGKSTFINALLRRRVLKAACAATTASITKVVPGPAFSVSVTFVDGTTAVGSEGDADFLRRHLLRFHPDVPVDGALEDVLDLLTSEPAVANHVRELEVAVPGAQLDERIVIIDTPGIGAGADSAAGHAALTQSVMAGVADCGVVLIPSANPFSSTLLQFLIDHAKAFLHRCVFVLTAVDRQSAAEREQVLRYVRLRLRTKLGLAAPPILQSAAISMIPVPDLPASLETAWAPWRPEFVRLESTLRDTMLRQRAVVVAERLARLLKNAVDEIGHDLAARQKTLSEDEAALARSSVATIDTILETLGGTAQKKIASVAAAIRTHVANRKGIYRTEARAAVDAVLNAPGWSIDTYETDVAPRVRQIIEHYGRTYAAEADAELAKLRTATVKVGKEFARQFEENYRTLRALEMKITVPAVVVPPLSVPAVAFHQSQPYVDEQQAVKKTGRRAGMALGAVAGALLLGPVGLAIGALAGRGAGRAVAGDALAALQSQLHTLIGNDFTAHLDAYESAIGASLDRIVANVLTQFRDASKRHREEYGHVAAEMERDYRERRRTVEQQIRSAGRDAEELSRRAVRLEGLQQRLAAHGAEPGASA